MSLYRELISENPMLLESKRFMRRFINFKAGGAQPVALVLIVLIYIGLLLMIGSMPSFPPEMVLNLQLALYCLLLPPMLQGCIAGEREKRTWETLLAAPVSKAQIVIGKYIGGFLTVLAIAAVMTPLVLWTNSSEPESIYANMTHRDSFDAGQILCSELLVVTFGWLVAAWCVFISSRSVRSFAAQGMIFGSLLLALVFWPIIGAILASGDPVISKIWNCFHPFFVLAAELTRIPSRQDVDQSIVAGTYHGLLAVFVYLGLSVVFLMWADRTLRFAESDVRFMPRRHRATNR